MKTHEILKEESKKNNYKVTHVPNLIVSFFTIVFALSIVFEIRNIIGEFMFIILTVFLGLFLTFNEYLKVTELKHYFKRNGKGNIFILVITFSLSVGLSVIGIYFWVDKTYKVDMDKNNNEINLIDSLDTELKREIMLLDQKYIITNNSQYKNEYSSLEFNKRQLKHVWKIEERKPILDKINEIENNIRSIEVNLNKSKTLEVVELKNSYQTKKDNLNKIKELGNTQSNKNKFISYIIILLTLLNDFVAIMFAKQTAQKELNKENFLNSSKVLEYLEYRKFVNILLAENKPKTIFHINEIMEMSGLEYKKAKHLLFTVLSTTKIVKISEKSTIEIKLKQEEGLTALDNYYNNYFTV